MSTLWFLKKIPASEARVNDLSAMSGTQLQRLETYEDALELDRAWHVLHYLLTESVDPISDPLSAAIFGRHCPGGGEVVLPWVDPSGGSKSLLTPEDVREVAEALGAFPDELVIERFEPAFMRFRSLYGFRGWSSDHPDDVDRATDVYLVLLERLRTTYRSMAEHGMGAMISIF